MKKLITNQILPHLNLSDFFRGLSAAFFLKTDLNFSPFFGTTNYLLCNSGRTGLGVLIDVLNLPQEKKTVGIPAFTCAVVATPFLQAGYEIVWIDTDENGIIDVNDFLKKSDKISALICIHVFGQKVDLEKFSKICKAKSIFLIEDLAHSFEVDDDSICKYADVALLSFGREKTYSCLSGGGLIWNNDFPFAARLENYELPPSSRYWTFQHLLSIFVYSISLPWWFYGGKLLPWVLLKFKILPLAVTKLEKNGQEDLPLAFLSKPLQAILWHSLSDNLQIKPLRKKKSQAWQHLLQEYFDVKDIIVVENDFRVILKTHKIQTAKNIRKRFLEIGIVLREWDGQPIAPMGTNVESFGYHPGDCKKAEFFSQNYITFPTHKRIDLFEILSAKTCFEKMKIRLEI